MRLYTVTVLCYVENDVPTMRDINRYVTRKNDVSTIRDINRYVTGNDADDWSHFIHATHQHSSILKQKYSKLNFHDIFWRQIIQRSTLTDVTWKTLEVALTNVNRQKMGLDPVDDVYGMMTLLT